MYIVDSIAYKYNSPKNLIVKRRMIQHEIFANATQTISYLLDMSHMDEAAPLKWENDLDRPLKPQCPFCGTEVDDEEFDTPMSPDIAIAVDDEAGPEEKYICPICFSGHPTEDEARLCHVSSSICVCGHCHNAIGIEDIDYIDEAPDPEEWYLVTERLGKRLATKGEMVLKSEDGLHIWGRRPSKDPVEEDSSISAVCFDLKLLDGQENYEEDRV